MCDNVACGRVFAVVEGGGGEAQSLTVRVQEHFRTVILTPDNVAMLPSVAREQNGSLVRVTAMVQQDALEDEYYCPTVDRPGISTVNTGLWTRHCRDANGPLDGRRGQDGAFDLDGHFAREGTRGMLQTRKRLMARCMDTGRQLVVAMYRDCEDEETWETWRQSVFKMNTVHELIGILECGIDGEPGVESCAEDTLAEVDSDEDLLSAGLMTLHLLQVKPQNTTPESFDIAEIPKIRQRVVQMLGACLGSVEGGELMLLALMSRLAVRVNGLMDSLFVGKLAVNVALSGEEDVSAAERLAGVLKQLRPVAGPVCVSNQDDVAGHAFSVDPIYPRLNAQNGHLESSLLQQPDGTVLIVDETRLGPGEFRDQGVRNLQSLVDLIRHQQVGYDYGVQQILLSTDMPVVLVSRGRSVLPFDVKIDCETIGEGQLTEEEATLARAYVAHCRDINCQIDPEMAARLEQDYVTLRKTSPQLADGSSAMNEQILHRLVNLARLRAISFGQTALTDAVWTDTKALHLSFA